MTTDRPGGDSGDTLNTDAASAPGGPASLSEMLAVLSRRPERRILLTLFHEDGAVSVESLAEAVAGTDSPPVANEEAHSGPSPQDHD